MILIIAKALVKDESLELFKREALELVKNSRGEDGCIEYSVYEDQEKSSVMTFVEKWEDRAAIEKHEGTEFFKEKIGRLISYSENIEITLNSEVL
ncbi:hypothetical protein PM10SUCC1_07750 [Propionigenium maris DSM 9537]|uniref:ABM domain-containing protein n=1 Tax=Propionigenium maris DSM 9537 TaxID=1123000 RepID=A0A9W6GJS5_9FUSO|nr:putative quinol monooxygenase [Propionigenium maris]GLI55260.1 hypothetical protein PM10SUCC1_07750 [Propionigenium maris DSM 9537]